MCLLSQRRGDETGRSLSLVSSQYSFINKPEHHQKTVIKYDIKSNRRRHWALTSVLYTFTYACVDSCIHMCSQTLHTHLYTYIIIFDNSVYLSTKVFPSDQIHRHSPSAAVYHPSFLCVHFPSFAFSVKFQVTCKIISFIMEFSYLCSIIYLF